MNLNKNHLNDFVSLCDFKWDKSLFLQNVVRKKKHGSSGKMVDLD